MTDHEIKLEKRSAEDMVDYLAVQLLAHLELLRQTTKEQEQKRIIALLRTEGDGLIRAGEGEYSKLAIAGKKFREFADKLQKGEV